MEKMFERKYDWKYYDKSFHFKLLELEEFMNENNQFTDLRFVIYLA